MSLVHIYLSNVPIYITSISNSHTSIIIVITCIIIKYSTSRYFCNLGDKFIAVTHNKLPILFHYSFADI